MQLPLTLRQMVLENLASLKHYPSCFGYHGKVTLVYKTHNNNNNNNNNNKLTQDYIIKCLLIPNTFYNRFPVERSSNENHHSEYNVTKYPLRTQEKFLLCQINEASCQDYVLGNGSTTPRILNLWFQKTLWSASHPRFLNFGKKTTVTHL
jgi:hypothetical protein